MRVHKLKTWPGSFQEVVDGTKAFEYRRNDRDFQVGDEVLLEEWDPARNERRDAILGSVVSPGYTGRRVVARVSFILKGMFGVPDGFAVLSLADVRLVEGQTR